MLSFEEWKKECFIIHKGKYEYLPIDNWVGNKKSVVKIICPIHGIFEQNASVHRRGFGCKKCSDYDKSFYNKRRFTKEQFIEKAKIIHGENLDFSLSDYVNMRTKIEVKCNICGEVFKTLPRDILTKHGCPFCKISHLEREVFLSLKDNNINFIWQYKINWLGKQSLDFYLPEYNIAIECQGKQHFGKGFTHSKRFDFEKIKEYDKRKFNLCNKNNVKLIYFLESKYNDFMENCKFFNKINELIEYILK